MRKRVPLPSKRPPHVSDLHATNTPAQSLTPQTGNMIRRMQIDPQRLAPQEVMALQRSVGNHTLQRLLQRDSSKGNMAEKSAEKSAEEVSARIAGAPAATGSTSLVDESSLVTPDIERSINHRRGQGQPLPDAMRGRMEGALGANFGDVRVHTDKQADSLSRSIEARAFTTGRDIFFKKGEFDPASGSGQRVIAHELAHVVQQSRGNQHGGSAPTIQRLSDPELLTHLGKTKFNKVKNAGKLAYFRSLKKSVVLAYKTMPNDEFDKELLTLPEKQGGQLKTNTATTEGSTATPKVNAETKQEVTTPEPEKPKVDPEIEKQKVRELTAANFEAVLNPLLNRFDNLKSEKEVQDLLDDVVVRALLRLVNEPMLRRSENLKKLLAKLRGLHVESWAFNKPTVGSRIQTIFKDLGTVLPGMADYDMDPEVGEKVTEGKNFITKRTSFMDEQRDAAKDIANPSLKVKDGLTIDGYKLLSWYQEATSAQLPQFYNSNSTPARSIHTKDWGREQENLAIQPGNWLNVWAQMKWKEEYVKANKHGYGRPDKSTGQYGLLGKVQAGTNAFNVEDKLWVKEGTGSATRYNDLGANLDKDKTSQARATAIRQVVSGDFSKATKLEAEAALAMLGAETARNPRSYGMGLMLLDLIENEGTYGKKNKKYNFGKLLSATGHDRESERDFKWRKTQASGEKEDRWDNMKDAIDTEAPQFSNNPFISLWAGKWPMSPSASMTLGTSAIPNDTSKLNTVQYKELKTILNWYINFMRGAELNVKNEGEAKTELVRLFRTRLSKTAKMGGGDFKTMFG